ncbi:CheR family methyltransferase [Bremerella sp.]|uniref:CheR family methyltransferase n=1 Tax=Bremerella sp. TaxID=2795602 RepID=UPI003919332D
MNPSPDTFETLRPLVEDETGMDFSGSRFTRLRDAVAKVLARQAGEDQLDVLLHSPQQRACFLEQVTAELTVGESFFFRNEHHMKVLREHVLPDILRENAAKREIRIWSAGCAGGEEPYSLAILLDEILGARQDWRVSILGTDLNPEFLERARGGKYRAWSFRHTHVHENPRYFTPDNNDNFLLAPKIRDVVRFAYLNLVKDVYPSPLTGTLGIDLILFRNVAIYLQQDVTQAILKRFHQSLRPGGWLLLGETEVSTAPTKGFVVRRFDQATFHQRPPMDDTTLGEQQASVSVLASMVLQRKDPRPEDHRFAPTHSKGASASLPDWVPLPKKRTTEQTTKASILDQVEQLMAGHRLEDANRAIERVIDTKQRARLRFRLVQAKLETADTAGARKMLERCLVEDPLLIEARLLEASFAEELGDVAKAEQAYRKALYANRNCAMAHFHLALLLQQKGDDAGARRSLKATLKLVEANDAHELVEYGEGVCFGRLKEMAQMIGGTG